MKRILVIAAAATMGLIVSGCSQNKKIKLMPYPQTATVDVVDNYFGTTVADPYRWLEDDNAADTKAWVTAQNEVTFDFLSQIPFRQQINDRITELWNYEKIGIPVKAGDYYFFFRNDGLQNQSVLYMMNSLDDKDPQVFLDPNTFSKDGTVALGDVAFSEDGKYLAYAVSSAGSDWVKIYVKEVPSGNMLGDVIMWVKFSGASWAADSKGFYYSAYDAPEKGGELSDQNSFQKVFYHELGTSQADDVLIFSDKDNPLRYFSGHDDRDTGKWLFIKATEGTHGNEILFRKVAEPKAGFKVLFPGFEYDYSIVKVLGDMAYVFTNDNAPNYRLAKIDLNNPSAGLTDVISEDVETLLSSVSFVGGNIFATYLSDATNHVHQCDMDGNLIREVELSTLGSVSGFRGKKDATETFYSLSSFISPPTVYKYDIATGVSTVHSQSSVKFNPDDFVSEQIFFESKDGTSVPMFVVHHKNLKKNGKNPVYLYGYGGFNISLTPGFNPSNIAMMEQGAVYVMVNLRGGGEYGENWHHAGMLQNKQNVFDDFIAAAEYMIANKYTNPEKIAIAGGSNGGLLVGACMTQRPDLFAVAFPQVGVLDMLRYHLFTVGWGWKVEYGSSENQEEFEYIYRYSPLHNIQAGVCYPATMITTGDHDDRVVPAHSFKFASALQAAQGCDNPILIRIETNAGHGAGKPTSMRIAEAADILSFFLYNTNTKVKY